MSRWLLSEPRANAEMRLFCFAHSGANAQAFTPWRPHLPQWIEPVAIELPGRGRRMSEPSEFECPPLVEPIVAAIAPLLDRPFVFFGQSMGSIIAYEVVHALRIARRPEPRLLIVSGIHGPSRPLVPENIDLDDEGFIKVLRRYETPDEWLDEPDLRAAFLPVIRADFELLELYERADRPKLALPIVAFGGDHDPMVRADGLEAWRQETSGSFELERIAGDHFYFQTGLATLVGKVVEKIERLRC